MTSSGPYPQAHAGPQRSQGRAVPASRDVPLRPPLRTPNTQLHPRWVLLATLPLTMVALVGIWAQGFYSAHACSLGTLQFLCGLDTLPGILQVMGIVLAAWLALGVVRRVGHNHDPELIGEQANGWWLILWRLTDYQRVRVLAWTVASVVSVLVLADFVTARLDWATFIISAIVLFAAVRCATYRPLPSVPEHAVPVAVPTHGPPIYVPPTVARKRPARVLGWLLPTHREIPPAPPEGATAMSLPPTTLDFPVADGGQY